MKRCTVAWGLVAAILLGVGGAGTTIGVGIGLDPTGILVLSALTETAIAPSFDLRAEAGIATDELAGLMLVTADLLYHVPFPPIDPFIGVGVGAALTPPPFSTGVVAEGIAGVRVVPFPVVSLFVQVRYLARWSGGGLTTGPIYEAGVGFRF